MIDWRLTLIGLPVLLTVSGIQGKDNSDWAVRCESEGDKRCYLVQNVFLKENKQRLATIAISRQGQDYFALVSVPLGVHLPSGAKIQVDDARPVPVTYQMCNPQGCHGAVPVSRAMLNELQRGQKLKISYQDATGRGIGVPFSLKDFNSGLEDFKTALSAPQDRRHRH